MAQEPQFRAVAGVVFGIPPDRPDLLLMEVKTRQGPIGLSMTKGIAKRLAAELAKAAEMLAPDRSAH